MKPPLELAVETRDANGIRTRWDSSDMYGGNRPQNLRFSTKRGEGFADASLLLARRADREWVDLNLLDDVVIHGADGSVAYEGRVAAMPRSIQASHSISLQLAGWMSHAKDRPFSEIFIDRDLSSWKPSARGRQVASMAAEFGLHGFDVGSDASSGQPALMLKIDGNWVSPYLPQSEAMYDAGPGNEIAAFYVWLQGGTGVAGNANFNFFMQAGNSDGGPDASSADLWSGTDNVANVALGPRRYVWATFQYSITPAGTQGASFTLAARHLTVYGNHGLPTIGVAPFGYRASDVIAYITRKYCPKLKTDGIQPTDWPIPHLVFKDYTEPYEAFLAVNAFHLWELAVWEDKTLYFGPSDRRDYDWEIRISDHGVTIDLQGDSVEDLANGIVVDFTDVATGARNTLTPADRTELQDDSGLNPVNAHGLQRWTKISLSAPTTADAAVQIGRAALTEFNAPKAPGTITVTGHVKDRAGHWQQGWKVRAGDMISITDHPNDSPRLITETQWDHDQKQLTITVDIAAKRLDAVLDRIGTALSAAGLS